MNNFYDFDGIIKSLEKMSYLNILSFCLLSGCGIKEKEKDIKFYEIYKAIKQDEKDEIFTNIFFTGALYKSSKPTYINKIENYYNFQSYLWKEKDLKKTISPRTQSLSITCMNIAARKIMTNSIEIENKNFIILCFIYASVKQLDFMHRHLLKDNLLYECKFKEKVGLKINGESLDILPQYLGCEAAMLTFDLLESSGYDRYFDLYYKEFFYNILRDLCHIAIKDAMYLSSRKLSQICDSLISIYNHSNAHKKLIYNTINVLGNELCERIVNGGELLRKPLDSKISSLFTICITLSALSKLYKINSVDNYLFTCKKLYDYLSSYWDTDHGFFIKNKNKKIEYSIKEIAAILSALKHYRIYCCSEPTNSIDNTISICFSTMILKSRIFINQHFPILSTNNINLPKTRHSSKRKPPVFIKKVQYKVERKKFEKLDESFSGQYSLWACKQLL